MTHLHSVLEDTPLAERLKNRHDPITGDAFQLGDEVVFCASCRSAFLKASWEYMDGTHCNQQRTLSEVPRLENLSYSMANPESDYFIMPHGLRDVPPVKLKKHLVTQQKSNALAISAAILGTLNMFYFVKALSGTMVDKEPFPALLMFSVFSLSLLFLFLQYTVWPYWPNTPPKEAVRGFGKRFVYTTNNAYKYGEVKSIHFLNQLDIHKDKNGNDVLTYSARIKVKLKNGEELNGKYPYSSLYLLWDVRDFALEVAVMVYYQPYGDEEAEELRKIQEKYNTRIISLWEEEDGG